MKHEKIHGMNLGNWLVLEKWMSPDIFAGVDAEDETDLCRMLPKDEKIRRLTEHRDTYITVDDFRWLAKHGINVVRIPVPHFIFGDEPAFCEPYVECISYLDKAFVWAKETGLGILIDLHTAPDSQNGFDNGGICGVCKFHQKPENVDRVIQVLGKLAERYADDPALWGIEILNEPISRELWQLIQGRYVPRDKKLAEGSSYVPLEFLYDFYKRAYHEIRQYLSEDKVVMFHDGFRLKAWKEFMQDKDIYKNVWLDTHIYVGMEPPERAGEIKDILRHVMKDCVRDIKEMSEYFPVVVGEWCLSHSRKGLAELSDWERFLSYRAIADAQLYAWDEGAGYFFWSYKLPSDPPGWDFRSNVKKGWFPKNISKAEQNLIE